MVRSRLGSIDHAWLRMERPYNPMMVTGVMTFDEPIDVDRLRRTIEVRVRPFHRFGQRIRRRLGRRAVWEDDPTFTVERHIEHRMLPQPADRATLQREISELVSTHLPLDRPLWALHVLENPNDGRTVIVSRLHHCIADGFALMYVLLSFTDATPDAPTGGAAVTADAADIPSVVNAHAARDVAAIGGDVARLAALANQPKSVLRGELGQRKRAAWSAPIALDEVKAIARRLGGTVNDVLMAATAASFARYLRERGEDVSHFDLRMAVPVNLRKPETMKELGNYFGLVFLELPLGIDDPRARFEELKRRMDRLKRSPEALVLLTLMRVAGGGPRWLEDAIVTLLGVKTTGVLTNVPGPREPRYLAGRRIETIMFWVPASGHVGLGVSIFSYAGKVRLGLASDALRVPDPERVLEAFPRELEALASA